MLNCAAEENLRRKTTKNGKKTSLFTSSSSLSPSSFLLRLIALSLRMFYVSQNYMKINFACFLFHEITQNEISPANPFNETIRKEISHVYLFAKYAKFREIPSVLHRFVISQNNIVGEKWKP
jgi:hypothetical protein